MLRSKVLPALLALALAPLLLVTLPSAAGAGVNISHDFAVTLTDGSGTAVPGTTTTYTLVVTNNGPDAGSIEVAPTFDQGTVGNWTCVETGPGDCGSGTGPINDFATASPGTTLTYTIPLAVPPAAIGPLTASVSLSTTLDPVPANNTATDIDTMAPEADLSITKTDGLTTVKPGQQVVYTVVATNQGPSNVDSSVVDTIPAELEGATWTCVAAGGASCDAANGTGNINEGGFPMPPGSTLTYTITATVADELDEGDTIVQTAVVNALQDIDPDPTNNTATDTDAVADLVADLVASKAAPATAVVGSTISYTIGVENDGPDTAREVVLSDQLPADTTFVSMTQTTGPAATLLTPAVGNGGTVQATWASLADEAAATFTVVVQLGPGATVGEVVVNTATVDSTDDPVEPAGDASAAATVDPVGSNNAATASTTIIAQATTTTTTTTSVTTTTAAVGAGELARTGVGSEGPVGLALFVAGAGLVLVGAAELRRIRATMR